MARDLPVQSCASRSFLFSRLLIDTQIYFNVNINFRFVNKKKKLNNSVCMTPVHTVRVRICMYEYSRGSNRIRDSPTRRRITLTDWKNTNYFRQSQNVWIEATVGITTWKKRDGSVYLVGNNEKYRTKLKPNADGSRKEIRTGLERKDARLCKERSNAVKRRTRERFNEQVKTRD